MENEQQKKTEEKEEVNQIIGDDVIIETTNDSLNSDSPVLETDSDSISFGDEILDVTKDKKEITESEIISDSSLEMTDTGDVEEITADKKDDSLNTEEYTEKIVSDSEITSPEKSETQSFDFSGPNQDDLTTQDQKESVGDNEEKKLDEENKKETIKNIQHTQPSKNYFLIVAIILVIGLVIFSFWRLLSNDNSKRQGEQISISVNDSLEQGKVSIIEETREEINVLTNQPQTTDYDSIEVNAFFANSLKDPDQLDCGRVFLLKRSIPKKYDSNLLNSVLGLLEPLSAKEKEAGYLSAIPEGTILKYIKLEDSGTAVVNFSGNLNKSAGSCAVTAIRAQIAQTLLQFSAVKSVMICIDNNCNQDEILQP